MSELRSVRLLGVPVAIWNEAASHADSLQREFDLISSSEPAIGSDLPARLLALIEDLQTRFGGVGEAPNAELHAAAEEGRASIDLVYHVPVEVGSAAKELGQLLDEADDYCRQGDLLTLVAPTQAAAFRRWFLGEFVRQTSGSEPRPWSPEAASSVEPLGAPSGRSESIVFDPSGVDTEHAVVEADADAVRVTLIGDIDLVSGEQVRAVLQRVIGFESKALVLDLTRVSFIDSLGLSVVMASRARAVELGRDVVIRVSENLARTFDVAGLAEFVTDGSAEDVDDR